MFYNFKLNYRDLEGMELLQKLADEKQTSYINVSIKYLVNRRP